MDEQQVSNLLFKYFVEKIVEWYKEVKGISEDIPVPNTLTKTTIIKLHFFVCTLSRELFNKHTFYAMQFGPVCGDLLDALNQNHSGNILGYIIDMDGLQMKQESKNPQEDSTIESNDLDKYKTEYDQAIEGLKKINKELVVTNAFNLKQISHSWFGWRRAWEEAKLKGRGAVEMDFDDIEKDPIKNYA